MTTNELKNKFTTWRSNAQTISYFEEDVSFAGIIRFCRNNALLMFVIGFAMLIAFGSKLFWYSIGIDTELYMQNRNGAQYGFAWQVGIGRFGQAFLQKIFFSQEFNPFTSYTISFIVFYAAIVAWCYVLSLFNKKTTNNFLIIPFAVLALTSPVWAEILYFLLQSVYAALAILICPFAIYYMYNGFLKNRFTPICAGILLFAAATSVYQSIGPLFCFGLFAGFLLMQMNSNWEPKVYGRLVLKLLAATLVGIAIYYVLNAFVVNVVNKSQSFDYLDRMQRWGKDPILQNLKAIGTYFLVLSVGNSRLFSVHFLIPALLLFWGVVIYMAKTRLPPGRRALFILAGIGIPLTIMMMPVIGAYSPPARSQWPVPFAAAFMVYFVCLYTKKTISYLLVGIALLLGAHQASLCAQLYYSDYLRYQEDVHLAYEFDRLIAPLEDDGKTIPIVFLGKLRAANKFENNYLEGEIAGRSFFGLQGGWTSSTGDGLAFMRSIGINYPVPNMYAMEAALPYLSKLPSYPREGCIIKIELDVPITAETAEALRNAGVEVTETVGTAIIDEAATGADVAQTGALTDASDTGTETANVGTLAIGTETADTATETGTGVVTTYTTRSPLIIIKLSDDLTAM